MFCLVASGTYLVNDVIDAGAGSEPPGQAAIGRWPAAPWPPPAVGTGASLVAVAVAAALLLVAMGLRRRRAAT